MTGPRKVRLDEERSDSKSVELSSYIMNNLPLVVSLLASSLTAVSVVVEPPRWSGSKEDNPFSYSNAEFKLQDQTS